MRYRIRFEPCNVFGKPYYAEETEAIWPFAGWKTCKRWEWPCEYASFSTIEEARNFIDKRKAEITNREQCAKKCRPKYFRV